MNWILREKGADSFCKCASAILEWGDKTWIGRTPAWAMAHSRSSPAPPLPVSNIDAPPPTHSLPTVFQPNCIAKLCPEWSLPWGNLYLCLLDNYVFVYTCIHICICICIYICGNALQAHSWLAMKCNLQSEPAAPGAVWILVAAQNGSSTFLAQGVSLLGETFQPEFFWSTYCGSVFRVLHSLISMLGTLLVPFFWKHLNCENRSVSRKYILILSSEM